MLLLALLCFLASAIWSAILRGWPMVLLAAGLLLWAAADYPVHLG